MLRAQAQVREFMLKVPGQVCPEYLTAPNLETRKLRIKLVLEEALELAHAYGIKVTHSPGLAGGSMVLNKDSLGFEESTTLSFNPVLAADAHADIEYVNIGGAVACGIELTPVFEEVHRSNMSKFIDGYLRDDGKWVKGPAYMPADVEGVLAAQMQRFLKETTDKKRKPFLICLDGPDNVGKTTLHWALQEELCRLGKRARLIREPGGTAAGEKIRHILKTEELSLETQFALIQAQRTELYNTVILPEIKDRDADFIIADRGILSTWAYQNKVFRDPIDFMLRNEIPIQWDLGIVLTEKVGEKAEKDHYDFIDTESLSQHFQNYEIAKHYFRDVLYIREKSSVADRVDQILRILLRFPWKVEGSLIHNEPLKQ